MVTQLVLQVTLLLWLTLTEASSSALALAASIAKSGCLDKCGNITIPYPFGIGANCFANKPYYSFQIICDKSFTLPKPFLTLINLEVLEISLTKGTVSVNNPVITSNCGDNRVNNQVVELTGTPFYFSDNYTRFTAMGCVLALITQGDTVVRGYMSICNSDSKIKGCYGINYCQTIIPPSFDLINASFRSIYSNDDHKECKYAFMVDQEWFTNLTDPYAVQEMEVVPLVLSWVHYVAIMFPVSIKAQLTTYANVTTAMKETHICFMDAEMQQLGADTLILHEMVKVIMKAELEIMLVMILMNVRIVRELSMEWANVTALVFRPVRPKMNGT
ncbi:wall-associated receptor kinase-like 10 [Cornus florida]|uniref:wall-associated receptor kinase-like 10 n=1 Tax=Cornus florida TaxID=4283 RepID=UPI0028A16454|nr:wall-associated receptor kinase-like 10 [Cornus florida]